LLSSCLTPSTEPASTTSDALLSLYRDPQFRPLVQEYFTDLTANAAVANAILVTADALDMNPSLAFAVAWNESRFNPRAVNWNRSTVDRGLFQLNSRTFAHLKRATVFDPVSNARQGLTYLKRALDRLGSEEKALGYYNAGIGLLTDRELPQSTNLYVKKVLDDRDSIDHDAIASIYFGHGVRLALR